MKAPQMKDSDEELDGNESSEVLPGVRPESEVRLNEEAFKAARSQTHVVQMRTHVRDPSANAASVTAAGVVSINDVNAVI